MTLKIIILSQDALEAKISSKENEIDDLKEKVVNLEAQIVEKTNSNDQLTKELASSKKALEAAEKLIDQLKSTNTGSSSSTTATKVSSKVDDSEPVLLSDPAG